LTNGIVTVHLLSAESDHNINITCSKIYKKHSSINRADTCNDISEHHANTSFISCQSLSL
jgi:DeoR/GlpR family transcriptional regulator of sugar metabolism